MTGTESETEAEIEAALKCDDVSMLEKVKWWNKKQESIDNYMRIVCESNSQSAAAIICSNVMCDITFDNSYSMALQLGRTAIALALLQKLDPDFQCRVRAGGIAASHGNITVIDACLRITPIVAYC